MNQDRLREVFETVIENRRARQERCVNQIVNILALIEEIPGNDYLELAGDRIGEARARIIDALYFTVLAQQCEIDDPSLEELIEASKQLSELVILLDRAGDLILRRTERQRSGTSGINQ